MVYIYISSWYVTTKEALIQRRVCLQEPNSVVSTADEAMFMNQYPVDKTRLESGVLLSPRATG